MKWTVRIQQGSIALALGAACVGGCQQFNRAPAMASLNPAADVGSSKVTPRQAADVQIALGRTLEQRGEVGPASAAYEEAVKRDPKRTDALVRLAVLNDQQGKFRESAVWYRKALQSSPGNPDIFCNMGYSLYLQKRWTEAEMNLQQALALKPDHVRARNNLGLVLAHTERVDQALAEFRKTGSEAEARTNLALALTMDQRWEEARAQYQAALAANPSAETAKNGLRQLDAVLARMTVPPTPEPGRVPREQPAVVPPRAQMVEVAKLNPDNAPLDAPEFTVPALSLPKVVPVSLPGAVLDAPTSPAVPEKPNAGLSQARTFFHLAGGESAPHSGTRLAAEER
jgi:tetratricopeptide (TPR) repeat protein